MCGNSGRREALITFFSLERLVIMKYSCRKTGLQSKGWIRIGKGFLVKHRLLDAAARR
jgi:hypothetical protein